MSALIGGAAAGVTCGIANVIPGFKGDGLGAFLGNLVLRSGIGAAVGGGISSATGGDFAYGAKQGAISAGIAYTANCWLSKTLRGSGGDKESKLASTQEEVDKQRNHDPNTRMRGWPEWLNDKLDIDTEGRYFDSKVFWSEYALRTVGPETAPAFAVAVSVFVAAPPPFDIIAGGLLFSATSGAAIQAYREAWVPITYDSTPKYEIYGH